MRATIVRRRTDGYAQIRALSGSAASMPIWKPPPLGYQLNEDYNGERQDGFARCR